MVKNVEDYNLNNKTSGKNFRKLNMNAKIKNFRVTYYCYKQGMIAPDIRDFGNIFAKDEHEACAIIAEDQAYDGQRYNTIIDCLTAQEIK